MNAKILSIALTAIVVTLALVVACSSIVSAQQAYDQTRPAAENQAGENQITQYSALHEELAPIRDKMISMTNTAQSVWMDLQVDQRIMQDTRELSDQERTDIVNTLDRADAFLDKADVSSLKDELSSIEARIDYSAMSEIDQAKARGDIKEIRARLNILDTLVSKVDSVSDAMRDQV